MTVLRRLCVLITIAGINGCGSDKSDSLEASGRTSEGVDSQKPGTVMIEIPEQTLLFKPTRDDFTVGEVVFTVYSSNPKTIQVNGSGPDAESISTDPPYALMYTYLKPVSKNKCELPAQRIEFAVGDHVCMSLKAWFNEVGNENDSHYYQITDDRYAIVSYCSSPPPDGSFSRNARFSHNRVATVDEFKQALSSPLIIRLNQKPLPE